MHLRRWLPTAILVASLAMAWVSAGSAGAGEDDPRLAVVSEATVNLVTRGAFGDLSLERADLASGRAKPSSPLGEPDFRPARRHPPRWRIGHGYYWGVAFKNPPVDFRGFRRFGPTAADVVRIPLADFRPLPADADARVAAVDEPPTVIGPAEPLNSALVFARMARVGPVAVDLVPVGSHACRLYVLFDGQIEVWDYRFHHDAPRGAVVGRWKESRRIPVDWNEPFLALPGASDRLFLATSSGVLWEVPADAEAPRAVWSDPERPIRWVILDAGRSRSFALGPGFSFLVEPVPRPAKLPRTAEPDDPLTSALHAARAVFPAP